MIDKKYGITPLRKCTEEEESLIKRKFQEIKPTMEKGRTNTIYWGNIFLNEQYLLQSEEKEREFKSWVDKIVMEVQNGVPQYVSSYGFLNNPSGSVENQVFHIDYVREVKQIFIPLTYLVCDNSTQFLSVPLSYEPVYNGKNYANIFGVNEKQLLEKQGVDYLVVSQVVCKPYTICKMHAGTVHRGKRNMTDEDRYMLYIVYTPDKFHIKGEEALQILPENK